MTDMDAGAQSYQHILTITDHYSHFVKFIALKNKTTEAACEKCAKYISDFGIPKVVLVDNGGEFIL